jgi:hypothetical protein
MHDPTVTNTDATSATSAGIFNLNQPGRYVRRAARQML